MVATTAAFRTSSSSSQMELELVYLLDFEVLVAADAGLAKTKRRVRIDVMNFIALWSCTYVDVRRNDASFVEWNDILLWERVSILSVVTT